MYEVGLFELRVQLCYVKCHKSGPQTYKIELKSGTFQEGVSVLTTLMITACFL